MDLPGLLSGVQGLGGVQEVTHYAADGRRSMSSVGAALPAELGAFVHMVADAARGAAPFLNAAHSGDGGRSAGRVRAVQLEYLDRVLVLTPVGDGVLAVLTREAASASTVKAWVRGAQFTLA